MAKKIKINKVILQQQKRKEKKRLSKKETSCRILIVCEGEKTEPNYFRSFQVGKNSHFVYEIECKGDGHNTIDVVNVAIEQKCAADQFTSFDSVWAVFDRDSFPKERFNSAIAKAKAHGIEVAWSNEAFELWYLYHFHNRVTAMTRNEYQKAISVAVNNSDKWRGRRPYKYMKNEVRNYDIMTKYGNIEQAIKWAKQQHNSFEENKHYADHNPCTLVYKLVEQLLNRDEKLIERVMIKINHDADNYEKNDNK